MPPRPTTLCTYCSGPQFTLCKALMPFSCTPTARGCSPIARTTASRPPASAMGRMASSEQARLCSAKQASSCSAAAPGNACMALTTASMPPAYAMHFRVSTSKARLPRAMQPCSWTGSDSAWARMAWTTRSMPPRLVISIRLWLSIAICCSAQQAFSWTASAGRCWAMAVRTASIPPLCPILLWFSSERSASFPRAPQAVSCKETADGWWFMASMIASMPPRLAIFFLFTGPRANSSNRTHEDSCFPTLRGSARIPRINASTSSSSASSSGPRQARTGGSTRESLVQPGQRHCQPHFEHCGLPGMCSSLPSFRHPHSSNPRLPKPESHARKVRVSKHPSDILVAVGGTASTFGTVVFATGAAWAVELFGRVSLRGGWVEWSADPFWGIF
mmetsp:Transcript_42878/g.119347  ORF Transcript_42878/g.119347 Transcript_42878/m.119347 type:complete len:389 (-) Transcript_42878:1169-2335(-)